MSANMTSSKEGGMRLRMAAAANVDHEATNFLQKLIEDGADEPIKLATRLFMMCQHMKMSNREQTFLYQVISRAMEIVLHRHGIDRNALCSSSLIAASESFLQELAPQGSSRMGPGGKEIGEKVGLDGRRPVISGTSRSALGAEEGSSSSKTKVIKQFPAEDGSRVGSSGVVRQAPSQLGVAGSTGNSNLALMGNSSDAAGGRTSSVTKRSSDSAGFQGLPSSKGYSIVEQVPVDFQKPDHELKSKARSQATSSRAAVVNTKGEHLTKSSKRKREEMESANSQRQKAKEKPGSAKSVKKNEAMKRSKSIGDGSNDVRAHTELSVTNSGSPKSRDKSLANPSLLENKGRAHVRSPAAARSINFQRQAMQTSGAMDMHTGKAQVTQVSALTEEVSSTNTPLGMPKSTDAHDSRPQFRDAGSFNPSLRAKRSPILGSFDGLAAKLSAQLCKGLSSGLASRHGPDPQLISALSGSGRMSDDTRSSSANFQTGAKQTEKLALRGSTNPSEAYCSSSAFRSADAHGKFQKRSTEIVGSKLDDTQSLTNSADSRQKDVPPGSPCACPVSSSYGTEAGKGIMSDNPVFSKEDVGIPNLKGGAGGSQRYSFGHQSHLQQGQGLASEVSNAFMEHINSQAVGVKHQGKYANVMPTATPAKPTADSPSLQAPKWPSEAETSVCMTGKSQMLQTLRNCEVEAQVGSKGNLGGHAVELSCAEASQGIGMSASDAHACFLKTNSGIRGAFSSYAARPLGQKYVGSLMHQSFPQENRLTVTAHGLQASQMQGLMTGINETKEQGLDLGTAESCLDASTCKTTGTNQLLSQTDRGCNKMAQIKDHSKKNIPTVCDNIEENNVWKEAQDAAGSCEQASNKDRDAPHSSGLRDSNRKDGQMTQTTSKPILFSRIDVQSAKSGSSCHASLAAPSLSTSNDKLMERIVPMQPSNQVKSSKLNTRLGFHEESMIKNATSEASNMKYVPMGDLSRQLQSKVDPPRELRFPFSEHQLKQLRAQCLVFLALRNKAMPKRLHLALALDNQGRKGCQKRKNISDAGDMSLGNAVKESTPIPEDQNKSADALDMESRVQDQEIGKSEAINSAIDCQKGQHMSDLTVATTKPTTTTVSEMPTGPIAATATAEAEIPSIVAATSTSTSAPMGTVNAVVATLQTSTTATQTGLLTEMEGLHCVAEDEAKEEQEQEEDEEEEECLTDDAPPPNSRLEYTTVEKWTLDQKKRKHLEEQNWAEKQRRTEERIAVRFHQLKEAVSSSEDISTRTKSVIELKKLELLQLQRRLRRDFLHDFFKPINSDIDILRTMKKNRPGRRMKQLERHELRQKEERLRRRRERQKEFFREVENHKEKLDDWFKGKRERLRGFNRYVKEFHKKKERAYREKLERIQREKITLLKNNDVEGYLRMVKDAKSDRVKQLLKETEAYLQKLGVKLQQQKVQARLDGEACMDGSSVNENSSEDQAQHYLESNEKYYLMAHSVKEIIKDQPHTLIGGKLREYQMNGLRWMLSLYNNSLNGILADEMGLGKTVQVIGLLCYLIESKSDRGPFLVVVPSSVLPNWLSELNHWAPTISKVAYTGSPEERRKLFREKVAQQKFNVLLTTYEYLMNKHDRPKLSKLLWHYIIIDEGHRIKNASCKLNAELKNYQSSHRLLLTGTPLQNKLEELWALLNFLLPNIFNSSEDFAQWFNKPFENVTDASADQDLLTEEENLLIINRLHQVLRPFMLRRLKQKVENELPEKIERLVRCKPSAYQQLLMKRVKEKLGSLGHAKGRAVHNTVMELRNICNHPYLSHLHTEEAEKMMPTHYLPAIVRLCGKLETLDRILPKLKASNHRILLFSTMTRLLDVMEQYLTWKCYRYLRLDGHTNGSDRGALIEQFNSPNSEAFLFLLSIRAGGIGINLQAADTVILFDTDWNPQVDLQAQARAHRIGQKRDVLVLRLETVQTVEEQVRAAAEHKLVVANQSITAGFFDNNTSAEDRKEYLEALLRESKKEEVVPVLGDEALNYLLARSDSEIDVFEAVDKARIAAEMVLWRQCLPEINSQEPFQTPPRLLEEAEFTPFLTAMHSVDVARAGERLKSGTTLDTQHYGRGKRARETRSYGDQLTEREFEELCQVDVPETIRKRDSERVRGNRKSKVQGGDGNVVAVSIQSSTLKKNRGRPKKSVSLSVASSDLRPTHNVGNTSMVHTENKPLPNSAASPISKDLQGCQVRNEASDQISTAAQNKTIIDLDESNGEETPVETFDKDVNEHPVEKLENEPYQQPGRSEMSTSAPTSELPNDRQLAKETLVGNAGNVTQNKSFLCQSSSVNISDASTANPSGLKPNSSSSSEQSKEIGPLKTVEPELASVTLVEGICEENASSCQQIDQQRGATCVEPLQDTMERDSVIEDRSNSHSKEHIGNMTMQGPNNKETSQECKINSTVDRNADLSGKGECSSGSQNEGTSDQLQKEARNGDSLCNPPNSGVIINPNASGDEVIDCSKSCPQESETETQELSV